VIDLLYLRLLTLLGQSRAAYVNQTLAESHGDRKSAARMSDPNTLDQVELLDMPRLDMPR
jgi:hypothetical protein